jgi:4-hydroxybenzoate polyprenyltransferase
MAARPAEAGSAGLDDASEPAEPARLPLCVDLDGTLVRIDTLHEQLARVAIGRPGSLPGLALSLLSGRAAFKRKIAGLGALDPARLPYQEDLLAYLKEEKARGRTLVLATAADEAVAAPIAAHLGIFDAVISSDGADNVKGATKAERLVARYGDGGFAYAGNSFADVPVWKRSGEPILVNAPPRLDAEVSRAMKVSRRFGGEGRGLVRSIIKAIRAYQWVKNVLVFLPLLLAHRLFDRQALVASVLTFFAFSLTASSIYVVNDLTDLDSDREHPRKRKRPFASGDLPLTYGILGPILMVAGLAIAAAFVSIPTLIMLVVYVVLTSAYSTVLKTKPLLDVFILAGLYTIRLLTGGVATRTHVSIWLLGVSLFAFLSLAFLKRASELSAAARDGIRANTRRGYRPEDHDVLMSMGVAAAFLASMILALYLNSPEARALYRSPMWLWFSVPVVLYGQCRLWLSAARGYMTDDPIVYAVKDPTSWVVVLVLAVVFALAMLAPTPGWM